MTLRIAHTELRPDNTFEVLRKCAGCGCKSEFISTNCFRVNANGNHIDVWLIYQCKKCKHTYNLTILSRKSTYEIPEDLYRKFMSNDVKTAFLYGTDSHIFENNKAQIIWDHVKYHVEMIQPKVMSEAYVIHNPCRLKLRTEKLVAELLHISRNKLKTLVDTESIIIEKNSENGDVHFINNACSRIV